MGCDDAGCDVLSPDGGECRWSGFGIGATIDPTEGVAMAVEPFVGRVAELARLRELADRVESTGVGRFVLVVGEAGGGKTRLCAEFAGRLMDAGVAVAWSRCWDGGVGPPLWPWPEVVDELARQCGIGLSPVPASPQDRFGRFQAVVDQLRALTTARIGAVIIDDLHTAGRDAVLLTHFIVRSLHRFPLLLVATQRPWARSEAQHRSDLDALARDAAVIDLGPFDEAEIAAYFRSVRGREARTEEVAELLAATGGSPMYVAELLRNSSLDERHRAAGLSHVLRRRVELIDGHQRRVLCAAAILGTAATVEEVAELLQSTPAGVLDAFDDGPWVPSIELADGQIRFSHDLVHEAFVAALPGAERLELHAAAARVIAGHGSDSSTRRARHAVEAATLSTRHREVAVDACAEASESLMHDSAFEQAAEWASRGWSLAAGGSSPAVEAELCLLQARAELACGRLSRARELYERAVEPSLRAGQPRLLATAALGLGGVWVEEQRDEVSRRRMLTLCRRALHALRSDPGASESQARRRSDRPGTVDGHPAAAIRHGQDDHSKRVLSALLTVRLAAEDAYDGAPVEAVREAVDVARQLNDPTTTAEALSLYHHTLLSPTHATLRLAVADELLDVAARSGSSIYALFGLCWRTVDLYLLGDPNSERSFAELRRRSTALRTQSIGYIASVLDVMRAFRRGDLVGAEKLADEALPFGQAVGDADAIGYYSAHLLGIRWIQGRIEEMHDTVTAVLDSGTLRRRDRAFRATLAYADAMVGNKAAARLGIEAVLADGPDSVLNFSTGTTALGLLIETAAELGDAPLAGELADYFAPYARLPVMPSLAVICLGPGQRTLGLAYATAGRLDEAIKCYEDALVTNRRLQNRPFDAVIHAQLAAVLRRRGSADDTETSARAYADAIDAGRRMGMDRRVAVWEAELAAFGTRRRSVVTGQGRLKRLDGTWYVEIDGRSAIVDHSIGLVYIAELLSHPGMDISSADLSAAATGAAVLHGTAGRTPMLDDRALADYQRRLGELDRELDMADLLGDASRAERAAEERRLLIDRLRRDTGLGGRSRNLSDEDERTRMRVSKAIHRTIKRLSEADAALGRAFETRIHAGYRCRYVDDPGHPIRWTVRTDVSELPG
jgi:tetratricopeptide (TPR) repeat protein